MRQIISLGLTVAGAMVALIIFSPYSVRSYGVAAQENATPQGAVVTGRVLSPEGDPVAEAKVMAIPDGPSRIVVPTAITDQKGEFKLTIEQPGKYTLDAEKQADGYPSTTSELYSDGMELAPRIEVHGNEAIRDLVIRLGAKAPVLTGRIVDADTGETIQDASMLIYRAGDLKPYTSVTLLVSKKGKFKALIPARSVNIEVKARGYEIWRYTAVDANGRADVLQLSRGDSKDVVISLRRLK